MMVDGKCHSRSGGYGDSGDVDLEIGKAGPVRRRDDTFVRNGEMGKRLTVLKKRARRWVVLLVVVSLVGVNLISKPELRSHLLRFYPYPRAYTVQAFQTCSTNTYLTTNLPWLEGISPLPLSEFVSRRDHLAQALYDSGIDAFIVEAGYTFQYYVNVSQFDWEPWEPEERPFLLVVEPEVVGEGEIVRAKVRFLAPKFEEERVRLLNMPFEEGGYNVDILTWEEHWDPFSTLLDNWGSDQHSQVSNGDARSQNQEKKQPRIMVDDEMRDFIQRGLSTAGFQVMGLHGAVETVKQTKSSREIDILRAVNTGTVEAVRAMRSCMIPGLTETEVMDVLDQTLRDGGLEPFFDLVLFDDDASNPHGGTDGVRMLVGETLVLIDVGAHLHGYSSDITRTFFPPFFPQPNLNNTLSTSPRIQKKLQIYNLVHAAQTASLTYLTPNNTAASVDLAARDVIAAAGHEKAFTHRVGHGIGIKAHESPYLHQGNQERLKEGMVFTSEPGVYLPGEFGVRIEDVLLVRREGLGPEVLSGKRAGSAWEP